MIIALSEFYAECAGQNRNGNCHILLSSGDIDIETYDLDVEEWLSENGWLYAGEDAYCPECRLELHD